MNWHELEDPRAFADYMETVDARLRRDAVDIPARPMHALRVVSQELSIKFTLSSAIAQRIDGWFLQRYGKRLNLDPSIGAMLAEIRGDAFAVRYPLIIGTVSVNPLSWVQDATSALFSGLSPQDLKSLAAIIIEGCHCVNALNGLPDSPLRDLAAAVSHMLARPADPGLSKWSSQQAVEKMLNSAVTSAGRDPRSRRKKGEIHALLPLVELAEEAGIPRLDRTLLSRVECTADARYGRLVILSSDAVASNQAAVKLCGALADWSHKSRRVSRP